MTRITLACPQALFPDYLQLRRCLMPSAAEAEAPPEPVFAWRNENGAFFAATSADMGEEWLARLQAPLIPPDWGADVAAAERARARIVLWAGAEPAPAASSDALTIILDQSGAAALTAIGLQPTAEDPAI